MAGPRYYPSQRELDFLLNALTTHSKVEKVEELHSNILRIHRGGGLSPIEVFVTDLYTVGQADVIEILGEHPDSDVILTISGYNGYTSTAVAYAADHEVGVFTFGEFLGALHRERVWEYVKRDKKGQPDRRYRPESA